MDSRQFEILVDIIQNTVAASLPVVKSITQPSGTGLQYNPETDSHKDVQAARETLQSIQQKLKNMQYEQLEAQRLCDSCGLLRGAGEPWGEGAEAMNLIYICY